MNSIRLYVGAVLAISATGELDSTPFAIITPSIEIAADEAREFAFEAWPMNEGWTGHYASIVPVDNGIYALLGNAAENGTLDLDVPRESKSGFRFKPPNDISADWPTTIH